NDIEAIIGNNSFWLYFISTSFPNALDEEEDISLSDFIYENYDFSSAEEWVDDFVQFSEDVLDENGGYVDDPNSIELSNLKNNYNFRIEFHPYSTLFIFNDKEIGAIEGHYKIRTLSWEDFNSFINGCPDPRIPLLMLPVLALEEAMIPKAKEIITAGLNLLEFKKEHINKIADMIANGLL
ncbi:MAG: immunity protein 19, partial [Oscillospiraceae bacterium]|nr:immunity protein 19 [Oscillospiraceae bacterium]